VGRTRKHKEGKRINSSTRRLKEEEGKGTGSQQEKIYRAGRTLNHFCSVPAALKGGRGEYPNFGGKRKKKEKGRRGQVKEKKEKRQTKGGGTTGKKNAVKKKKRNRTKQNENTCSRKGEEGKRESPKASSVKKKVA